MTAMAFECITMSSIDHSATIDNPLLGQSVEDVLRNIEMTKERYPHDEKSYFRKIFGLGVPGSTYSNESNFSLKFPSGWEFQPKPSPPPLAEPTLRATMPPMAQVSPPTMPPLLEDPPKPSTTIRPPALSRAPWA